MTLDKKLRDRRYALIYYILAAAAPYLLITIISRALHLSKNAGHATFHLSWAFPILFFLLLLIKSYKNNPRAKANINTKLIVLGLLVVALSLVIEAVGAFGYDGENSKIHFLTELHNSSLIFSMLGLFIFVIGIIDLTTRLLWNRHIGR